MVKPNFVQEQMGNTSTENDMLRKNQKEMLHVKNTAAVMKNCNSSLTRDLSNWFSTQTLCGSL